MSSDPKEQVTTEFDTVIVAAMCGECGEDLPPTRVKYDDALDPERDFESRLAWPVPARSAALHGRSFQHLDFGRKPRECGPVLLSVEPVGPVEAEKEGLRK